MELIHLHELLKKLNLVYLLDKQASPDTILEAANILQRQLNELETRYRPTLTFEGINLFIEKVKIHVVGHSISARPVFLPNGNTDLAKILMQNELLTLHKTDNALFGYSLNESAFFRVSPTAYDTERDEVDIEYSILPINLTNFPINQYSNFMAIEYILKFGIPLLKLN